MPENARRCLVSGRYSVRVPAECPETRALPARPTPPPCPSGDDEIPLALLTATFAQAAHSYDNGDQRCHAAKDAKIVHGDLYTHLVKVPQCVGRVLRIDDDRALGNLQFQLHGIDTMFLQLAPFGEYILDCLLTTV